MLALASPYFVLNLDFLDSSNAENREDSKTCIELV